MPTMIHRNAVKELNLVISVIYEVWIEDRVERKPPKYTIGLNVVQIARVEDRMKLSLSNGDASESNRCPNEVR